jgi:nitrite reductase/ring-hydroxylating ferredoxin subunit
MGEDLVVYRTRSGIVRAVDPYCPHLRAHLGDGEWVDGERIVCPFHSFAYDVDGACILTGYATKPPPQARLAHRPGDGPIGLYRRWARQFYGPAVANEPPLHAKPPVLRR